MMRKYNFILFAAIICSILLTSCKNDDDNGSTTIPLRDRGEEAIAAEAEIRAFLETHFYNYEEFQSPPVDFDYRIQFDTIAGDNADKTPLIEQVSSKMVNDRVDEDVKYELFFLKVNQGGGEASPNFPDLVVTSYEGQTLNENEVFDASVSPIRFDLTQIINGLQDAMVEFNEADPDLTVQNPDGTVSFGDFGIGAVFVPSGLGYYAAPPTASGISTYDQLIFTFQLFDVETGDQDNDGVISILEDRNNNKIEEDDDTDGDGVPDFLDSDDDGDGTPTSVEIEFDEDGNIIFMDTDNDGIPNYLDSDS